MPTIQTPLLRIDVGGETATLLTIRADPRVAPQPISVPVVCIDGVVKVANLSPVVRELPFVEVFADVREYRFIRRFTDDARLSLELILRVSDESPVVRFRCLLHTDEPVHLTKIDGRDALTYFAAPLLPRYGQVKEIRISEFSSLFHTFLPTETELSRRHFDDEVRVMGPILVGTGGASSLLLAYEHGSQVPDAFLDFRLLPNGVATLNAVKGNYCHGQEITPDKPWESLWFQIAVVSGGEEELAHAYRDWVLKKQTPNAASRTPHIFYNTWNYQERVKNWQGKPYLSEMNEERMLAEIDIAHRMGIDVFVVDTGWYEKTGDWQVSRDRFPRGLAPLKAKLDAYGMKLGLWFDPPAAAVSSRAFADHADCVMTSGDKPPIPHPVWETEESHKLCLVSRFGDAFADGLIDLHRELGVSYFKWDAIGQYGCDAPDHGHGTRENTPEERRQSYAFQLGAAMARIVDRLCAACPDAIVDFDITEGGRTVGLQFLSAGKYFLVNNGPYSHDYNMPTPADGNVNLFFYPGPARAWICRSPLGYDKWLPSILFLTHYLPDDTYRHGWGLNEVIAAENQWIAIASLVLGQNGIWGDLLSLSDDGIERFGHALSLYRQVSGDITEAFPVRAGQVGGSPEVHEKVHGASGRGVVSFFAAAPGVYTYVTRNRVAKGVWHNAGVQLAYDDEGRARIDATFARGEYAKLIFFEVAE